MINQFFIIFQNKVFEYLFHQLIQREKKRGYYCFDSVSNINNWSKSFDQYFKELLDSKNNYPDKEEIKNKKDILWSYKFYAGWGSFRINKYLRKSPGYHFKEDLVKHIGILDKEFEKFSLDQNLIVVRKINKTNIHKKIKTAEYFVDLGYLSTSLDKNYRKNENSDSELLNNHLLFIIKVPIGTPILYLGIKSISDREEYELLLKRNSKLFIERKLNIGTNTLIISEIKNNV